ncbi:hypothetical protein [Asticcacaulis sp. AC466]|uniref:hypothetical protein n=1 Tax=Asticcacaulis sp. AC466 TaxID=1282362 RepID=UPI0012DEFF26|nr:hypothetical protein [Asticcacaulis sp. AC466]
MSLASMSIIGISGAVPREFLIDCAHGSLGRIFASPLGFDMILISRHLINTVHSYISISFLSVILLAFGAIPMDSVIYYLLLFPLIFIYSLAYGTLFVSVALLTKSEKITQLSSFFVAVVFIFLPNEHFLGQVALFVPFSCLFTYIRTGAFMSGSYAGLWVWAYGVVCTALAWVFLRATLFNLTSSGRLLHKEA